MVDCLPAKSLISNSKHPEVPGHLDFLSGEWLCFHRNSLDPSTCLGCFSIVTLFFFFFFLSKEQFPLIPCQQSCVFFVQPLVVMRREFTTSFSSTSFLKKIETMKALKKSPRSWIQRRGKKKWTSMCPQSSGLPPTQNPSSFIQQPFSQFLLPKNDVIGFVKW